MKKFKSLAMVCALSLMLCGFTTTAYASGGDNVETPQNVSTEETAPLTPDGNLTLVDDIVGEQAENKQFVTMQSKNGNYFYLVIDRDGDKENVYFLNLVDEADLLALIEDAPTEVVPDPTPPPVEETKPPVDEETKPEETGRTSSMMLGIVLVAGLIGGGAFAYFKVLKSKSNSKDVPNLDEYEYEDDEEELVLNEFNEDDFEDDDEETV